MNNETTFEQLVRGLVAKIPAKAYGVLVAIFAMLDTVFLLRESLGIELSPVVVELLKYAHVIFVFLRPVSKSDAAVMQAAKLETIGQPEQAAQVVAQVVEEKKAKL